MIFHIALAADWDAALAAGAYRMSTIGVTLDQEGFVHASFAGQVAGTARRYYADVTEPLVLLHVDEGLLDVPVRVGPQGFPHVRGPVAVAAVTRVTPLQRSADGELVLPALEGPDGNDLPARTS